MKLRFREKNPVTIAIAGLAILAVLLVASFQLAELPVFGGKKYEARFTEAGGLQMGNTVRVAGAEVGQVKNVTLDGPDVVVEFTAKDVELGDLTSATIGTQTLLGERNLEIRPDGRTPMEAGGVIPLERTVAPYSITEGIEDLTRRTGEIDMNQVSTALDTFTDAFQNTPDELGPAFEGITRLSRTIASRDAAIGDLLERAESVTGVLNRQTAKLTTLLTDGNKLLGELEARRDIIGELLVTTRRATDQIVGLTEDQRGRLAPALNELNGVLEILERNEGNIVSAVERVSSFITGLGEGLAGGPFFAGHGDLGNAGPTLFPAADFLPSLAVPTPPAGGAPPVPTPPSIGGLIGAGGN
ncbi:mammalian cell entry protein [Pseudonocardia sp. EC080610-09]|uniref:MCE family protein n=1 Tax=unclassified Pseudonocardia TaxID=2619320 RepID=UPI0006CB59A5|nr:MULTISPECIES: MCE family protein [unclassified Pseudonocardia]ALE74780.1 mammalian cell entry protein [Pseudonocardia sp. EC080625-04]ALL74108.1 mammalian cell entry protein [Pseudonocardia sp. EC080610-09]ALL81131.1 mammalian cell entry protein [Pseudonocardia sp. EC080619-01]